MAYMTMQGAGFTPFAAYNKMERTINYGPSETIAIIKKGNNLYFLSKFRNYYSAGAVRRGLFGLWYGRNDAGRVWGEENDKDKAVNYYLAGERNTSDSGFDQLAVYGTINDPDVVSLEIEIIVRDNQEQLISTTIKAIKENNDKKTKNAHGSAAAETTEMTIKPGDPGIIYGDMFITFIEQEGMQYYYPQSVSAFNKKGELIFEEDLGL